jgi:cysteinyl-tRNA synthetase
VRSLLLRRHYREDWDFREEDLELESKGAFSAGTGNGQASLDTDADRKAFYQALDDDLDTPEAMRVLDRVAASAAESPLHPSLRGSREAKELLKEVREILGLLDL